MNKHIIIFTELLTFIYTIALIIGLINDDLFVTVFYGVGLMLSIIAKELVTRDIMLVHKSSGENKPKLLTNTIAKNNGDYLNN